MYRRVIQFAFLLVLNIGLANASSDHMGLGSDSEDSGSSDSESYSNSSPTSSGEGAVGFGDQLRALSSDENQVLRSNSANRSKFSSSEPEKVVVSPGPNSTFSIASSIFRQVRPSSVSGESSNGGRLSPTASSLVNLTNGRTENPVNGRAFSAEQEISENDNGGIARTKVAQNSQGGTPEDSKEIEAQLKSSTYRSPASVAGATGALDFSGVDSDEFFDYTEAGKKKLKKRRNGITPQEERALAKKDLLRQLRPKP